MSEQTPHESKPFSARIETCATRGATDLPIVAGALVQTGKTASFSGRWGGATLAENATFVPEGEGLEGPWPLGPRPRGPSAPAPAPLVREASQARGVELLALELGEGAGRGLAFGVRVPAPHRGPGH